MATAGIKVLIMGRPFRLPYEVCHVTDPKQLMGEIARFHPDVLVTSGIVPGALNLAAFEIRKRWIHVDPNASDDAVIGAVEACYASNLWGKHPNADANPLISIFTPTFNTGDFLRDAYQSLREQSYSNWEWVCVDDFSTDETWNRLVALSNEDIRVRPYRNGKRSGKIGETKDTATKLCRGGILVETDHDDALFPDALEEIKKAFSDPEVGFVYSNCTSLYASGEFQRFNDDFWKDRYRWTERYGKRYLECLQPDGWGRFGDHPFSQWFTYLTVGPNHVRAYRKKFLEEIGPYNHNLSVADDADLFIRAFLASVPPEIDEKGWRCKLIDKLIYRYNYHDAFANTTFTRNKQIQDTLALVRANYADRIKAMNDKRLKAGRAKAAQKSYSVSDISYVIPEGFPSELTEKCLASIRKFSPGSEIILVSNGKPSLEPARALADKVVDLEMNLRFAGACNRGVMEASREVVAIINNDCEWVDDSPRLLAEAVGRTGDVIAPYSNRAKPPQGDVPYPPPKQDLFPEAVVGVCMLMRTDLYRALGGFDARLYTWEDDDICHRARSLGKTCTVVGGSYVAHERHATFKARGENVQAVMNENRTIFNQKHPKIRVIAIAKDESSCIQGFFEQFRGVTTDFCLVDTGSTDNTVELALAAGAKVQPGVFENFAQARNDALHQFGRDVDWVIMVDPDERLDSHTLEHLKELLFRTPHDILLAPLQAVAADGSRKEYVPKPFCFRSRPDIRWVFKVHEKLVGSLDQAIVVNARIDHQLPLHTPERRASSASMYDRLSKEEPYFTDPKFKAAMLEKWPILDYDRMADDRIKKIHIGPLVSVVIPTYKRKELLERAVRSALNQDYANLEVVVVGDGCPDLERKLQLSPWGDPRVRAYNLPSNHGAGGAVPRNFGIMLAAGSLIGYCDDDNLLEDNHISSLYSALRLHGAAFAFSSMKVSGRDLIFEKPEKGSIDTSCVLHRKDLVRHGFWKNREEDGYAHDYAFFKRFTDAGERWVPSKKATLIYNAETSGQEKFLMDILDAKTA